MGQIHLKRLKSFPKFGMMISMLSLHTTVCVCVGESKTAYLHRLKYFVVDKKYSSTQDQNRTKKNH